MCLNSPIEYKRYIQLIYAMHIYLYSTMEYKDNSKCLYQLKNKTEGKKNRTKQDKNLKSGSKANKTVKPQT